LNDLQGTGQDPAGRHTRPEKNMPCCDAQRTATGREDHILQDQQA
jgi:hypothetical protein